MARIVVLGATGYTGQLVVAQLVAAGHRPTLAGRNGARLTALAARYDDLPHARADVTDPDSVRGLVSGGDVLVSTVGPFGRYGRAALEAATSAGAHYVDTTGESEFVREVFEVYGPRAQRAGCALLSGIGYDFFPGNAAGALALRDGGPAVQRLDIGYFMPGIRPRAVLRGMTARGRDSAPLSSGTIATIARSVLDGQAPSLIAGQIAVRPIGREVHSFPTPDGPRRAALAGGSEPHALPRLSPALTNVRVYMGVAAPARALQALSYAAPLLRRRPLVGLIRTWADSALTRTGQGPDAQVVATTASLAVAIASDRAGRALATASLLGPNAYQITGYLAAWTAGELAQGRAGGSGALGPVDAFGLDRVETACTDAGFRRL
ncbi:MAG: saccharopine dehydrogenase family protein [Sporichthyaceae bacterium]